MKINELKNYIKKTIFISLIVFVFNVNFVYAGDGEDFQYWSRYSVNMLNKNKWNWTVFAEGRMYRNAQNVGLYYLSQKVKYDLLDNVSMGVNYTYLRFRSLNSDNVLGKNKLQHRLEFEINPHKKFSKFSLLNRNRVEFRWIEDKGSYNTRYRNLSRLTIPITKFDRINSVYVDNEIFYNIAEHEFNEVRTVPFGISLKCTDSSALKVFYMIQSQKGENDWSGKHIFGTLFSYKFS